MLSYYYRRIRPFLAAYFLTGLLTTAVLALESWVQVDWSVWGVLKTLASGVFFLALEFVFFIVPFLAYLLVLPAKYHNSKWDKWITFVFFAVSLYLLLFKSVSEYFFWEEFTSRFNFIAVDYLVYTQEVIENIYQSYPLIKILSGAFVITAAVSLLFVNKLTAVGSKIPSWKSRAAVLGLDVLLCVLTGCFSSLTWAEVTDNRINNELASGGAYGFVYAFFHNELDYKSFYPTLDPALAEQIVASKTRLREYINPAGEEKTPNVILVLMESMSAEYLDMLGGPNNDIALTPNLRRFAEEGVYFPNTYATGTRTVRGIEALTISVPPLPGMSIVRRKGNENLYTVGSIFRGKGYDTQFIYGGIGFFDNMNYYFKNNGFEIIDKTNFAKDEIRFANAWGVSDEDLFAKAIKEADKKYAQGKKFFQFLITTSNHRPFTYPEGTIDIPSGTGRAGAVKYADYAIGQLVKEAQSKPWFEDTVFVFVADHESGSAGKEELNPDEHRIPFIVYGPKYIAPKRYDKTISQIDALPTFLALLNFKYENRFYGQNALADDYQTRYFLINYQKLGYVENNILTVLKPVGPAEFYRLPDMQKYGDVQSNAEAFGSAVSFFQQTEGWKDLLGNNKR